MRCVRQLTDAKLTVHRVSGKAVHDYAEIFDGVPSQHDGKDAAMVAELAAMGKSSPWPYQPPAEFDQELRYWVERMDVQQRIGMLWLGRLEALLARHWPEATQYLELNSETLLQVLVEYGGPAALAADPQAAKRLQRLGRSAPEKAKRSSGSCRSRHRASGCGKRRSIGGGCKSVPKQRCRPSMKFRRRRGRWRSWPKAMRSSRVRRRWWDGRRLACSGSIWAIRRDYHCAEAYRKAMGLNLKERSSGRYQGQLKITKRGPGRRAALVVLCGHATGAETRTSWSGMKSRRASVPRAASGP